MSLYGVREPPSLKMPSSPISRRRLEGDWLAMDDDGRVALFAGGDAGPIPIAADPDRTTEALAAMDAAQEAKRTALRAGNAYRESSHRPAEPIFDLPRRAGGHSLHEEPYDGYPHLVFACGRAAAGEPARENEREQDPQLLREMLIDVETRDALSREGLALILPSLGEVLHEALHEKRLCAGCRVLDQPDDPRLRAPEVIAAGGLYVFAHPVAVSGDSHDADVDATYYRVASPSVPADAQDVEPAVLSVAELVRLPLRFEQSAEVLTPIMFPTRRT